MYVGGPSGPGEFRLISFHLSLGIYSITFEVFLSSNHGRSYSNHSHWLRKSPTPISGCSSQRLQNRGIGRAICAALVHQFSGPLIIYEASRAGASFDLTGLIFPPAVKIYPAQLSLTDQASITALSTMVDKEHQGCDILINNAGLYYFQENITAAERQETLDVNYRGTLNVCQAFSPIMRKNSRIVNISSQSGQLKYFSPRLQTRFSNPDLTLTELDALVNEYSRSANQHTETASGWPPLAYFTSKAALNAATRILARENPIY
ncbi:unnamed protein product [Penicillium egyptiacum]|uniref:Uncharacterized protein n=1 Tax=Penicillium egyptiacum TaxID=1303716 RepID=A0A9W4KJG6_9EURO|nr:unnamed protein product [Penicillium egyptiacum]